jgi:hypothetical protein
MSSSVQFTDSLRSARLCSFFRLHRLAFRQVVALRGTVDFLHDKQRLCFGQVSHLIFGQVSLFLRLVPTVVSQLGTVDTQDHRIVIFQEGSNILTNLQKKYLFIP